MFCARDGERRLISHPALRPTLLERYLRYAPSFDVSVRLCRRFEIFRNKEYLDTNLDLIKCEHLMDSCTLAAQRSTYASLPNPDGPPAMLSSSTRRRALDAERGSSVRFPLPYCPSSLYRCFASPVPSSSSLDTDFSIAMGALSRLMRPRIP